MEAAVDRGARIRHAVRAALRDPARTLTYLRAALRMMRRLSDRRE
jgi:hypothetical protein